MPMARKLMKFCVTGFFACGGSRSVASSFPLQCNSRKAFFDCMEASVSIQSKKSLVKTRLFAEEEGIEPPLTVLETAALPLYYSSID